MLNILANVLARFRKGDYAMMADITKYFFQTLLPEHQQNLFRTLWYENNDIINANLKHINLLDTFGVWSALRTSHAAVLRGGKGKSYQCQ